MLDQDKADQIAKQVFMEHHQVAVVLLAFDWPGKVYWSIHALDFSRPMLARALRELADRIESDTVPGAGGNGAPT